MTPHQVVCCPGGMKIADPYFQKVAEGLLWLSPVLQLLLTQKSRHEQCSHKTIPKAPLNTLLNPLFGHDLDM